MSSGDTSVLVPAPRRQSEHQDVVVLIRSLASAVTDHEITHEQAVDELRRQLTLHADQSTSVAVDSSRRRGGVKSSGWKPVLSA